MLQIKVKKDVMAINKISIIFGMVLLIVVVIGACGYCAAEGGKVMVTNAFENAMKSAKTKEGVKQISYEQFKEIRKSGEAYILFDVLPPDSYIKGHIEGAVSFPVDTINKENAKSKIKGADKLIVYCGSFQCSASTIAAKKLSDLGYYVLDYKGGLKEWQERGNNLVK